MYHVDEVKSISVINWTLAYLGAAWVAALFLPRSGMYRSWRDQRQGCEPIYKLAGKTILLHMSLYVRSARTLSGEAEVRIVTLRTHVSDSYWCLASIRLKRDRIQPAGAESAASMKVALPSLTIYHLWH